VKTFKRKFYKENMNLLKKSNDVDDENSEDNTRAMSMNSELALQRQAKECNRQIKYFIETLVVAGIARFYGIEIRAMVSDPKKDLLFNLVARFIISDEIYFLVFNTISVTNQRQLHKLTRLNHD
jgi:hypothetical protein